jgi:hypothetical protein
MSIEPDQHLGENLRRWVESGQPRRWVESRCGAWDHRDWLILLANLRHSEFWPMEPAAVGAVLERLKQDRANLRRWQESGHGRRWVEARKGQWDHEDWLQLLRGLQGSVFWPLEANAVGRALEGYRTEWHNLRNWEESGQPRRWVEAHQGTWDHDDWAALVKELRRSACWPLDLNAAGILLEGLRGRSRNLPRWPRLQDGPEREEPIVFKAWLGPAPPRAAA